MKLRVMKVSKNEIESETYFRSSSKFLTTESMCFSSDDDWRERYLALLNDVEKLLDTLTKIYDIELNALKI